MTKHLELCHPFPWGKISNNDVIKIFYSGTSPAVKWLRLCLPMQEARVQSLVGKLRSHMPWGVAKNLKKKKKKKR